MVRVRKKLALILGLMPVLAALFIAILPLSAANAETRSAGAVYVIPVKMTVESGLASFLDRALTEAEDAKASLVVLDVDTPGGRLDTAEEIGIRIRETTVPTVAFVSGKAASAGAYLALNAGDIAMAPATTIGAAMIVDQNGNAVDNPKYVSFWSQEMAGAAELNGRNSDIAVKMVDPSRELTVPELGETYKAGTILSLSAEKALKVGYADTIAKSVEEVIAWKGLNDRPVIEVNLSLAEHVSEFLTSPGMTTILLILGIAGVAIELLVPGFGVPGIVGVIAFGLYFFGQFVAGFAGMEAVVLFVIGLILLVSELFIPSFGILGILGSAAVIAGITMGAQDTGDALSSLGLSLLIAILIIAVFVYIFRKRGVWNRFILREALTTEQGYVPNNPRESLIGSEGVAISELRPAGIAEIRGERVDVVTGGEFVERGRMVRVVAVDGTRIVVQEVKHGTTKLL
ncbi:NfeD family protein [Cohnella panacarvi]|uniref:NfeD family protein n=1 Tax=Cohnella panacarvi TaxID=400776 RepID=UPI00047BEDE2|nr:nodulation protein NfeD [Cohnella panacarvi]